MSPKATFPHQNRTEVNELSKITRTNGREHHQPTIKDPDPKASQMSNKKWQTQARQFISNFTPQQTDAYLAIPEVAME
jgi:hypothetical protein